MLFWGYLSEGSSFAGEKNIEHAVGQSVVDICLLPQLWEDAKYMDRDYIEGLKFLLDANKNYS
jgi:hypothetical protein